MSRATNMTEFHPLAREKISGYCQAYQIGQSFTAEEILYNHGLSHITEYMI